MSQPARGGGLRLEEQTGCTGARCCRA
eukprot:COSAG02_NODE_43460_length_374_cov_1.389091_1_plen_26_part_01